MAANQRCERWADAIKESLALRLGADPVKAYDSNKDVYVTLPTGNLIIKFEVEVAPKSGEKDSLGLTQTVYAPHVIKVLFDTGVTGGGGAAATEAEKFLATAEAVKTGAKVVLYSIDAGADALAIADLASATKVAEYQSEWGVIGNV